MKNKGFTLVELLGVIVVLAIVLGIVSVSYIGINNGVKSSYYKTLEESILLEGNEYFAYEEDLIPKVYGDSNKVLLSDLINNKYITNIVDRKGNTCDLENSYVIAYKNSNKTNYYTCLSCPSDDYISENNVCEIDFNNNYSLIMTPTINDTTNIYTSGTWISGYVTLTFQTYSDISKVYIENETGGVVYKCDNFEGDKLKTCKVKIEADGSHEYTYYGVSDNNQKTREWKINILIDNDSPTFNIYDDNNNLLSIDLENEIKKFITTDSIDINNKVLNISDGNGSGIKEIKYSFSESTVLDYNNVGTDVNSFDVNKTLSLNTYKLIVEVIDNINHVTKKEINYIIKKAVKPTVSISISGDTVKSGYKSGAKVTVTCESEDGISSYTAKDNTGDTGSWSTNTSTKKVKKITLSSASSSRKVSVSCTSVNGLSNSDSKTYKIYVYSKDSDCGIASYSYSGTCKCYTPEGVTALVTKSCNKSLYNNYGTCSKYCNGAATLPKSTGTCTRSTNYATCWHT